MASPRLSFSHIGFHVCDLDAMVDFCTKLIGLELTDRGTLRIPGEPRIAFNSSDSKEHHQIALLEERGDAADAPSVISQSFFHVDSLDALREMKSAAEAFGVRQIMPLSHGNSWLIYFADPAGNGSKCSSAAPVMFVSALRMVSTSRRATKGSPKRRQVATRTSPKSSLRRAGALLSRSASKRGGTIKGPESLAPSAYHLENGERSKQCR